MAFGADQCRINLCALFAGAEMADVQLENGFLQISIDFWEALCRLRVPGEARQIFDFILRQTWGWKKKQDQIPLSKFVLGTGLSKKTVTKARKKLIEMNLIFLTQLGDGNIVSYRINKDFETWKPSPKKAISPNWEKNVSQLGENRHPKSHPQYIIKKRNILFSSDSPEFRLSKLLLDLIRQRRAEFKEPNLQTWCRHVNLILRVDGRSPSEIEETITAVQKDSFWQNNILSTAKLREKYDQLRLKLFSRQRAVVQDGFASVRETVGGVL